MCCTFGDLTDVHWWRELQLPVRTVIGRDGRLHRETPEWLAARAAPRRRTPSWPARPRSAPARRWSRCCARPATSTASRQPTQRMANFYEKGDKPLEIVSTRQWYIRNGGRDADAARRAASSAATRSHWVPAHMQHRYDNWVERPQRRLADLAGSGSSASRSRSGTRSTTTASPTTTHPLLAAARPSCRSTRRTDAPRGLRRGPARQAGRLRRRPRRDGHLGDLVADPADRRRLGARRRPVRSGSSRWTCAPRRTTSSAPGCSPAWSAPTTRTTSCRGRTR